MQRIYADGEADLDKIVPLDWKKPEKKMNHRSNLRIIELINKIREDVDGRKQQGRKDKEKGFVKFFIVSRDMNEKTRVENGIKNIMSKVTSDTLWNSDIDTNVVSLFLEHKMAAARLGFAEMFNPLYDIEDFNTGLLNGDLSEIKLFEKIIYPLLICYNNNNDFGIMNILKKHSPLLDKIPLELEAMKKYLLDVKNNINKLCNIIVTDNATFKEVIEFVDQNELFYINDVYRPILLESKADKILLDFISEDELIVSSDMNHTKLLETKGDNDLFEGLGLDDPEEDEKLSLLEDFLSSPFMQIEKYISYMNRSSGFYTHQSVKGLEYPRVLVSINDDEMGGFLFQYDKLFGVKDKTSTDIKNEKEGKETGVDRTRRLFYVICSRAEKSLAIVAYTDTANMSTLKNNVIAKNWFEENEILEIKEYSDIEEILNN